MLFSPVTRTVIACEEYAGVGVRHGGAARTSMEAFDMSRTPNDDRSDSLNPNNDAYQSSQDNRSDQLNPNNERYQGEKESEGDED